MNAEEFLSQNNERYTVIKQNQNLLNHITEVSYQEIIKFIEYNSKYFFDNRESILQFVWNIHLFTIYNFTKLELILNVLIYFYQKIKQFDIKDIDILDIMTSMHYDVYYLFSKNLISLESIIQKSIVSQKFFAYFYHEIDDYDHEYAEKRKDNILNGNDSNLSNFLKKVIANPEDHKQNREKSNNPSPLHKSIREDDIEEFQSILAKNNYDINYNFDYSYYERTLTECKTPSLIQIAATYGSIKIFKFLWMQPSIIFDDNLICYAISGRNYEIIHICETKCPIDRAFQFSINSHQYELTDYFIDISEGNKESENLEDFEDNEDNIYSYLNHDHLIVAFESANYHILLPCLKKIAYIMDHIDNNVDDTSYCSFLRITHQDFELFKFLYSHKSSKIDIYIGQYPIFLQWIYNGVTNAVEYMIKDANPSEIYRFFQNSLIHNAKTANFILDWINRSMNNEIENKFSSSIDFNILLKICKLYNEDLIDKVLKYTNIEYPERFLESLMEKTSKKFINSLFKRKLRYHPIAIKMVDVLKSNGFDESAQYILEEIQKKH